MNMDDDWRKKHLKQSKNSDNVPLVFLIDIILKIASKSTFVIINICLSSLVISITILLIRCIFLKFW